MDFSLNLPDLEERFLPPPNWQIKQFCTPETGHDISYRSALIDNAKGDIICLPGLSEYGEKYIETARELNAAGYNVHVIDWAYQGLSTRFKNNDNKRSSDGYNSDISDLHHLITQELKLKTPCYFLAHSMGGHLALRYAAKYRDHIKAIATSTPMIRINSMKYMCSITGFIFSTFKFMHNSYVLGGKDWHEENRLNNGRDIFSSDPVRDRVHNAWCIRNPEFRVGNPTYKWLSESLKSICILKNKKTLRKITCPVLLVCAGNEKLVDNNAIIRAAKYLPNDRLVYLENAKHELLMETDNVRDQFMKETMDIFNL